MAFGVMGHRSCGLSELWVVGVMGHRNRDLTPGHRYPRDGTLSSASTSISQ